MHPNPTPHYLKIPFPNKKVYVAWTNTDMTEGRGKVIPLAVCECRATAIRMGANGSTMGSDCAVTECIAVEIEGRWLAPAQIHLPTIEDRKVQESMNKRDDAIKKARAAGLSEEDIKHLSIAP